MLSEDPLAAIKPVVWSVLGYQFEAASMIAALSACLIVRIWVWLSDLPIGLRAKGLNAAVTSITMLFTAAWVMLQRPSPFYALLCGSGFGALGSGIILVSLNWVRSLDPLDKNDEPATPGALHARKDPRAPSSRRLTKKGRLGDDQP